MTLFLLLSDHYLISAQISHDIFSVTFRCLEFVQTIWRKIQYVLVCVCAFRSSVCTLRAHTISRYTDWNANTNTKNIPDALIAGDTIDPVEISGQVAPTLRNNYAASQTLGTRSTRNANEHTKWTNKKHTRLLGWIIESTAIWRFDADADDNVWMIMCAVMILLVHPKYRTQHTHLFMNIIIVTTHERTHRQWVQCLNKGSRTTIRAE